MDKNTRNLLICCVVSSLVGIIMGVGLVAPSVEPVIVEVRDNIAVNELAECQDNVVIIQSQFDQCVEQATVAQELARRALENADRMSELFDECVGLQQRTRI